MPPRLLPEWAPQDGILLCWPHRYSDWRDNLNSIIPLYQVLVSTITQHEEVILLVHDEQTLKHARESLSSSVPHPDRLQFVIVPSNDTWVRDYGPLTIQQGHKTRLLNFQFNGWGNKFNAELDNKINKILLEQNIFNDCSFHDIELILEGGSIDTDGQGTILTTRQCLLNPNRNPGLDIKDYEHFFRQHLGCDNMLWISGAELSGDDTDGHIDMLARFCNVNTIAFTACDDANDPQYLSLLQMHEELKSLRNREGEPYDLIALPIPKAIYIDGERRPASYANFLFINNAVLVPMYEDPMDDVANQRLSEVFSERKIIPVPARAAIQQGGSLHCLSMQLPAGLIHAKT